MALILQLSPELLHLGEEAFGFRMGAGDCCRLRLRIPAAILLPLGQFDRRFDADLDIEVAAAGAAQDRHALAAQAELLARLGAGRDGDLAARAVDGRHLDLRRPAPPSASGSAPGIAGRRRRAGTSGAAGPTGRLEIAGGRAAHAHLAFARQADAGAVVDGSLSQVTIPPGTQSGPVPPARQGHVDAQCRARRSSRCSSKRRSS